MADREHHTIANDVTHAHGVVWQTVADAAGLAGLTIITEDIAQQKVILQTDTRELWVPLTTVPTFRHLILPATTSIAGEMSAADKTKLNGISTGADVTSAALVAAGTTTADVAATANKLGLIPLSMGLITTGTTQPISFTDALFTGQVTGGAAVGTSGTVGIVAAAFASSGAETGTGAGQGGLGAAAAADRPYPAADFPGGRYRASLTRGTGQPVALLDVLTTAGASFPASVAAPVYLYLSRRTDLGADLKWRGWFYFTDQATGNETSFTPNASLSNVAFGVPKVVVEKDKPTAAAYTGVASPGAAEIEFGVVGDIVALGTVAAGASGKVADAAHVHTNVVPAPAGPTEAARRETVDAGAVVVLACSTAALPTYTIISGTVAGGDAVIEASANGAFPTAALDGVAITAAATGEPITSRFLLHNAAATTDNNVWCLTVQGDAGTKWRAAMYTGLNTSAKWTGCRVKVLSGEQSGGGEYCQNSVAAFVLGTSAAFLWRIDSAPSRTANEYSVLCDEDFNWGFVAATTGINPSGFASSAVNGGGAGATMIANIAAGSVTRNGIITCRSGTGATGRAGLYQASTSGFVSGLNIGFRIFMKMGVPIVSDGTNTFSLTAALTDATATAAPTNCIGLTFQPAKNANNWLFTTAAAGTPTDTDTGRTITAATDDFAEIRKDPGDAKIYCFMNKVLVGSGQSSNVPSAALGMTFQILRSATVASRDFEVDMCRAIVFYPQRRA